MKKCIGVVIIVALLVAVPVHAQLVETGKTYQCWNFGEDTQRGILPEQDTLNNPNGMPSAIISDLSGTGVSWTNNISDGVWYGDEFKIVLDIPNYPERNPYKDLTISFLFQGEVSALWMADADTGLPFTALGEATITPVNDTWQLFTQKWQFKPNPREEIVVLGLRGIDSAPAYLDTICIETECVPEPGTLALLGLGVLGMIRGKRKGA